MTDQTRDERIEKAAGKLVLQLHAVHDSPAYQSVWATAYVHWGQYTGPTYTKEFEELEAAVCSRRDHATPPADVQTIAQLQKQVEKLESQLAAVREFREHLGYSEFLHYATFGKYSVDAHYVNQLDAALREAGKGEVNG